MLQVSPLRLRRDGAAEHALVHDGLHVDHMRLAMGTSMGAMHTWIWGEMYPDFMDALMPLARAPVEIAGRNRMFRAMVIQAIRNDPEWKNGEYIKPPEQGLVAAQYALWMITSSALQPIRPIPRAKGPMRRWPPCGSAPRAQMPTTCCITSRLHRLQSFAQPGKD